MSALIVAEVAQAHDGSLGTALAYIDAIGRAGADVVKFQTHIAEAESTPAEPWRVRFSPQDETRYDYWRRMEFSEAQWRLLKERADAAGVRFVSSPFSIQAVELLERVGIDAWKIASGEVGNLPLLDRVARSGRAVWLSTGMSDRGAVRSAVEHLQEFGAPVTVLQCTSLYPTPPEKVGLNQLQELKAAFPDCGVGLSDHSGTIFPALAAVALGASVVEVHVCFSRDTFGPDVSASITLPELAQLVQGVRFLERALAHPIDKDRMAEELAPMRALFGKSVVAARDLAAGTRLSASDLALKKPGTGLSPDSLPALLDRTLRHAVRRDEHVTLEDVE